MTSLKHYLPCIFILLLCTSISCSNESAEAESAAMELTVETTHADDDLIALAESAAPIEISGNATIIDMEGNVLREGTNRWTCLAMPGEPMCLDEPWMSWAESYMNQDENVQADSAPQAQVDLTEIKEEIIERLKADLTPMIQQWLDDNYKQAIERVAWEVIPDLAENLIRQEIKSISESVKH